MDRRDFLKNSAKLAGCSGLAFPLAGLTLQESEAPQDHYFLQIIFPGGMDPTYTFDARPLAMTEANLLQNFIGENPEVYEGVNGQKTLRTILTKGLDKYLRRFSVLNGVHMSVNFDGHPQNMNYMMTGNPFGGDSFIPGLNNTNLPLDYVRTGSGNFLTNLTNTGGGVLLSAGSLVDLGSKLKTVSSLNASSPLGSFVGARLTATSQGKDGFAKAAELFGTGFQSSAKVQEVIGNLKIPEGTATREMGRVTDTIEQTSLMIGSFFRSGLARSAIYVFNTDLNRDLELDTHDNETAKAQPVTIPEIFRRIVDLLDRLDAIKVNDNESVLDRTTVMLCTEFGRTMRNDDDVQKGGTDHNPLTNTILIGGKGIKGGLVLGSSDFTSVEDVKSPSGAHKQMDPSSIKMMGKPFDFSSLRPRTDKPGEYNIADYLTFASVINTVNELFKVPRDQHMLLERNGAVAPVLNIFS